MIYKEPTQAIPQEHRKAINQKILHVIETGDMQGLTQQDIFEAYSPMGALHGLEFKDFDSFHAYTEAKKKATDGQYFTPFHTSKTLVDMLGITKDDTVCDMTCGHGAFFNFLPNQYNAYGCELDSKAYRVAKFLYPNATIDCNDVRQYEPNVKFDFMVLNPPFNLNFDGVSSQHYVCKRGAELLKPLGIIGLIVPKSFMDDEMMNKKDIDMMNENYSFIGQYKLPNDEFKSMGVANFETKIMFFQKTSEHVESCPFVNVFGDYKRIASALQVARTTKKQYRVKTLSELVGDDTFLYKVNKYLYEFKTHKNLQYYHTKAKELLHKYQTQKRPEKMESKEWDKIKLTEAKVLSVFKRVMKGAYKVEVDKIRLVKHNHAFSIKGYSAKTKHIISKRTNVSRVDTFNLVTNNDDTLRRTAISLGCDVNEFDKVIGRKRLDYKVHNTPISELPINNEYNKWLTRFRFKSKGDVCKLHKIQKIDLNGIVQRRNSLIAWSMGTGKSVALLAYIKFLQKFTSAKNVFITAPAIAVDLTLKEFLTSNGIKLVDVTKGKQLQDIKDGDVIIMTLGRLTNNANDVKNFVKSRSNKVAFIFDESDEITNYLSKRTRAVMNAFRRCDYKLLMTGTTTRNNITEFYSNYELLYNNSYNMMCESVNIFRQDPKSKEKEIKRYDNKRVGKPFDAYFGYGTFRSCFSPTKASVFGIQKKTQDIYNSDDLKKILNSTVITRTFEEVAGKKFKYNTIYVQPNLAERELQQTIMTQFHEMCYNYFQSTGNSRKESYLRIIRMINLLIKSTSTPHLFTEWTGQGLPTKYSKVMKMIEAKNEKVLIGCVGIESTVDYYEYIKAKFPNRQVWYVDGSISFKRRDAIVKEFEATENGIIVANQAALKSSVNIPTCNEVILVGLQWNFAKINQFVFRTIRFDSKELTNVNIVCYADSIELNVLNLLLNKERVNAFMRTTDLSTDEEVYENYDVDSNVLGSLIQKHYDEDGGMHLSWGSKEIIKD